MNPASTIQAACLAASLATAGFAAVAQDQPLDSSPTYLRTTGPHGSNVPWTNLATVPRFDSALGVLREVELRLTVFHQGIIEIENTNAVPTTSAVTSTLVFTWTSPRAVEVLRLEATRTVNVTLAPFQKRTWNPAAPDLDLFHQGSAEGIRVLKAGTEGFDEFPGSAEIGTVLGARFEVVSSPPVRVTDLGHTASATRQVTYRYHAFGDIAGLVWEDLDSNGRMDPLEPPLWDTTVELTDRSGRAIAGFGAVAVDWEGRFRFQRVPPGDYRLRATPPSEAIVTFDPDGGLEGSAAFSVTLGSAIEDAFFGFYRFPPPVRLDVVGGQVWWDFNGDAALEPDEPGMEGVRVRLSTLDGSPAGESITGAGGRYEFGGLLPGWYRVEVMLPEAVRRCVEPTFDPDGNATADTAIIISDWGGHIDFGYYPAQVPTTVSGVVWDDRNGNGVEDEGEPRLAHVPVRVAGTWFEQATETSEDGSYVLNGLGDAWSVDVRVTPPEGWVGTFDVDGAATANHALVVLGFEGPRGEVNFGFRQLASSH